MPVDVELRDLEQRIAELTERTSTMEMGWPGANVARAWLGFIMAGVALVLTPSLVLLGILVGALAGSVSFLPVVLVAVAGLAIFVTGLVIGILAVVDGNAMAAERRKDREELVRQRLELEARLKTLKGTTSVPAGPAPAFMLATF